MLHFITSDESLFLIPLVGLGIITLDKVFRRNELTEFSVALCLATQLCPTLGDPMDCSLPGSSVNGDSPGKNTGVGCYEIGRAHV